MGVLEQLIHGFIQKLVFFNYNYFNSVTGTFTSLTSGLPVTELK